MEKTQPIRIFNTTDLPLVSYLRYKGYTVKNIEKFNNYKVTFTFEDVSRELLTEYNSDLSMVEPKFYASTMHQLNKAAQRVIKESQSD